MAAASAGLFWLSWAVQPGRPAAGEPPDKPAAEAVVVAVGDIRLDGPVGELIEARGPGAPAGAVLESLRGDVVLGNLECALTRRGRRADKKWTFRAPPARAAALKAAGFTLLNLANNHVADFGLEGLLDTFKALDAEGLPYVGAGRDRREAMRPRFVDVRGMRIGFMGLTSTYPEEGWARRRRPGVAHIAGGYAGEVRAARAACDFLVVTFHGGDELAPEPNEVQREAARAAIEAGADIFIGHHPHVLQPVERHKGRPILYSLGNFLFVSPTPSTRWSAIARMTLRRAGPGGPVELSRLEFVPVDTWGDGASPASPEGVREVLRSLDLYGLLTAEPEVMVLRPR